MQNKIDEKKTNTHLKMLIRPPNRWHRNRVTHFTNASESNLLRIAFVSNAIVDTEKKTYICFCLVRRVDYLIWRKTRLKKLHPFLNCWYFFAISTESCASLVHMWKAKCTAIYCIQLCTYSIVSELVADNVSCTSNDASMCRMCACAWLRGCVWSCSCAVRSINTFIFSMR